MPSTGQDPVLKVSSPMSANLPGSDYASDPEKEVSDDDDDDRNHKHRRRETHSQSSDKNSLENISTRLYRNQNRSFENGHAFLENKRHAGQYNAAPTENHFPGRFGKRPFELNERISGNHSGDLALGRGRGRNPSSWNHHNNSFTSLDVASQFFPRGTAPPGPFQDRGLNIPNAQSACWGGYGLMSAIPNGSVQTLRSIGLQGTFGPTIASSLGIPRQRCRDFEERGFCLRGDMCPMEHGINRIVVEDVQSLSQFNLPVSLSNGPILGSTSVPGSRPSIGAASTSMINNRGPLSRKSKHGILYDNLDSAAADLYDPDEPLWNNDGPETSSAFVALHSSPVDEAGSLSNGDGFNNQMNQAAGIERRESTALSAGSHNTSMSIWGRIGSSLENILSRISTSGNGQNEIAENQEALGIVPGSSNNEKRVFNEEPDPKAPDSSKAQRDAMCMSRKPTQMAQRTLFVNGIPHKNNKRNALLAHFQKFGKVVHIYIPINKDQAFVQFSKREEAEAALEAPDAVMGNRFIKLRWANRDNSTAEDGSNVVAGVSSNLRGSTSNLQSAAKHREVPPRNTSAINADQTKLPADSSPKLPPPLQKKLELEKLKEALRKKQEMLDQKRNDFKRQLDKLAKQASGVKGDDVTEQVAKRQKVELASDQNKEVTPRSSDFATPTPRPSGAVSSEEKAEREKSEENGVPQRRDSSSLIVHQESTVGGLKQMSRPSVPSSTPFSPSRYKLDNRPTTFMILPPLPSGLANVAALKEHFSSYGDITVVELEESEAQDNPNGSDTTRSCSARVGFRDRQTAEKAFLNCKSWRGHYLQFKWVASSTSHAKSSITTTNRRSASNFSSAPNEPSESTDIQSVDKEARISSENGEFEHSEREKSVDRAEPAEVCIS